MKQAVEAPQPIISEEQFNLFEPTLKQGIKDLRNKMITWADTNPKMCALVAEVQRQIEEAFGVYWPKTLATNMHDTLPGINKEKAMAALLAAHNPREGTESLDALAQRAIGRITEPYTHNLPLRDASGKGHSSPGLVSLRRNLFASLGAAERAGTAVPEQLSR